MTQESSKALAIKRLVGVVGWTAASHIELSVNLARGTQELRIQREAMRRWGMTLARIMGLQVEVAGALPPQGVLLMSNHRSYADVPAILSALDCTMLAKAQVAQWPILGSGAKRAGIVFVERGDRDSGAQAQHKIALALQQGVRVVVFPEGTTLAGPGLGPMKPGAFKMAAHHRLPIVPVALEYDRPEVAWVGDGDTSFLPHFLETFGHRVTRARLAFGQPLQSDDPVELEGGVRQFIEANLVAPTGA